MNMEVVNEIVKERIRPAIYKPIATGRNIVADEIGARPPYMYTSLCPDERYRPWNRPGKSNEE